MVARTRYARPRYLPMVFALAGDSTMTSDVEPGSHGCSFSTVFAAFLALVAFVAVFVARFFALFVAMLSAPSCDHRCLTNPRVRCLRASHGDRRARSSP